MRILSATDAINPAFERTKLLLFTPFRLGRTLRLGLTGYHSYASLLYVPFPLLWLAMLIPMRNQFTALPWLVPSIAAAAIVLLLLFTWIFHLCTRLGFSFFDIVLNRGELVAPAWRRYGPVSRRWTRVKIAFGCVFTLLLAAPVIAYSRHLMTVFAHFQAIKGSQPSPEQMNMLMASIFSGYFIILFGFLVLGLTSSVATDFVVPSLALEGVSLKEGFRRLGMVIKHETGQFFAYVGMKLLLGFGGYMVAVFATELVCLIIGGIIAAIVVLIGFLLHMAGVPLPVLLVVGGCILALFYVAVFLAVIGAMGVVVTFLQAYLLYFLGGRYGLIGDALDRSTPPPPQVNWPPQFQQYPPPPRF